MSKTMECPSCAMEVDAKSEVCPICGYEFPKTSRSTQMLVILMVFILLIPIIFMLTKLI